MGTPPGRPQLISSQTLGAHVPRRLVALPWRARAASLPSSSPLPPHDPQPIARRVVEVLLEPQVALGGLDGGVPQRDLDLLERRAAPVGELGEGAPQVVRRDPAEAGPAGVGGDGLEDRLRGERTGADAAGFGDGAQHGPRGDPGGRGPAIEHRLGPGRHRDGADAAVLADEIDDRPAALALRDVALNSNPANSPRRNPQPTSSPSSTRSRRPFAVAGSGASRSCWTCGRVSQLPLRTPERRAPGTRRMATAVSVASRSFEAASMASLRTAASARLTEAAESERSTRCER